MQGVLFAYIFEMDRVHAEGTAARRRDSAEVWERGRSAIGA